MNSKFNTINQSLPQTQYLCKACSLVSQQFIFCQCKKAYYCSQKCLQQDNYSHAWQCNYAEEKLNSSPVQMNINMNSRQGLVGLQNLGNTSIINSCLQCLSHTKILTKYFLHGSYSKDINKANPLGFKGKLANAYAKVIKGLWCDSNNTFTPKQIKIALGKINNHLIDYSQKDPQELLDVLIDTLHEGLNKVLNKPYVSYPEIDYRPDQEIAKDRWTAYLSRNQSIISDLMIGQLKIAINCPVCLKLVTSFEPFIHANLPITGKQIQKLRGFFINRQAIPKLKELYISFVQTFTFEDWMLQVTCKGQVGPESFVIYFFDIQWNVLMLNPANVKQINQKLLNKQLKSNFIAVDLDEIEAAFNKTRDFIIVNISMQGKEDDFKKTNLNFPLVLDKQTCSGQQLYRRIFNFFFKNEEKSQFLVKNILFSSSSQNIQPQCQPFYLFFSHKSNYSNTQIQKNKQPIVINYQNIFKNTKKEDQPQQISILFNQKMSLHPNLQNCTIFSKAIQQLKLNRHQELQHLCFQECLSNFSKPKTLKKGEEWYCPHCKEHRLAQVKMNFYHLPKILIFVLNKTQNNSISKDKPNIFVDFPLMLDMKQYTLGQQVISPYSSFLYELYAVMNKYGHYSGHFASYCKNDQNWYHIDDCLITKCSPAEVITKNACVLFYERKQL